MAQSHPDDKTRVSDQIKELSGLCLICSGLPVLIPGVTLTVVGFTSDTDDSFKKFGSLHIFGLILLTLAIVLITIGLILRIVWRHVTPRDLQRVINASIREDQQNHGSDLNESWDNRKTTKGLTGTKTAATKQQSTGHQNEKRRAPSKLETIHGQTLLLCGITLLIPGLTITILGFSPMSDDILGRLGALHIIGLIILIIALVLIAIGIIILIVLKIKSKSKDHRIGQAPISKSTSTGQTVSSVDNEKLYYNERRAVPHSDSTASSQALPPLKGPPQSQLLRSSSRTNNLTPVRSKIIAKNKSHDSDSDDTSSTDTSSSSSGGFYTHKYGSLRRKGDIELAQVHKPNNSALIFEEDRHTQSTLSGNREMNGARLHNPSNSALIFEQEKRPEPTLSSGGGQKLNYLNDESSSKKVRRPVSPESETEDSDSDSSGTSSESDNNHQRPNNRNRPQSSRIRGERI